MLLAVTFLILVSSLNIDDIIGQTYAMYIIIVAGAESAIGLAILVAFYRLRGSIRIEYKYNSNKCSQSLPSVFALVGIPSVCSINAVCTSGWLPDSSGSSWHAVPFCICLALRQENAKKSVVKS